MMKKMTWVAIVIVVAVSIVACKKLGSLTEKPDETPPEGGGAPAANVEGSYTGSGTNPEGGSYKCDVTIARKGGVYQVMWYFDGQLGYEGTGILKGHTLVVGFANPQGYGVVAYTVKADGSLDGTWSGRGSTQVGTEKLKRK